MDTLFVYADCGSFIGVSIEYSIRIDEIYYIQRCQRWHDNLKKCNINKQHNKGKKDTRLQCDSTLVSIIVFITYVPGTRWITRRYTVGYTLGLLSLFSFKSILFLKLFNWWVSS